MLNTSHFDKNNIYLLACSGGVDSIALFHLMLENSIKFEVAIVNYNFRPQSKKEVNNVKQLCLDYDIVFNLYENTISITNNMEQTARNIRYSFFSNLMNTNKFSALVTGHNLNDKVEWFLMQFTKGAGISELTGMDLLGMTNGFKTIKPLIAVERSDIEFYLTNNNYIHYHDESNSDLSYHPIDNPRGIKRNYFRHNFAAKLTKEFKDGINRSFDILEKEKIDIENMFEIKQLQDTAGYHIKVEEHASDVIILKSIDKTLKTYFQHVLTAAQRVEILKQKETGIALNDIAIGFSDNNIYITPYLTDIKLSKKMKNKLRIDKIPPKNRPFFQQHLYK